MINIGDAAQYLREYKKYHLVCSKLVWFKKNKYYRWLFGQNFGDYLSFVLVGKIARSKKLKEYTHINRLLAIGSILHFAKNNDVIWGSGVNGKVVTDLHRFDVLDVRSVRGPKTRNFLVQKGISVNAIYGDPALLMPKLFPNLELKTQRNKIIVIPNLNEEKVCIENTPENFTYISPMNHWTFVLNEILTSELVLSSSLHGIILAEAFGVPVRFVKPVGGETMFKYEDYYLGTNRELTQEPSTFKDPITSKSGIEMPDLKFDISMLLDAFPVDLFKPKYKTIS